MCSSGSGTPSKTKNIRLPLPGRLASEGLISGSGEKTSRYRSKNFRVSRSSNQPRQVNLDSNTKPPLPGSDTKHRAPKSVSFGGTTFINPQEVSTTINSRCTYSSSGDIASGLHGFMHLHCPECQATHEAPSGGIREQLEPKDWSLGGQSSTTSSGFSITTMVDAQTSPVDSFSVSPDNSSRHSGNGCVSSGLGCSSGFLPSSGSVVRQGKELSHKSTGTQSSPSGSQIFLSIGSGEIYPNSDRQYNHNVLPEQTGGNKITTSVSRIPNDMALAPGQGNVYHSGTPARSAKRRGRFPEQTSGRRARLGPTRRSRRGHLRSMGSTPVGSLCRRNKQEMPRLRIQVLPSGISRECPVDQLVRDISLRLSTDSPHTGSNQQILQLQNQNDSDSATMAPPILVHGPTQLIGKTSQEVAVQTGSPEQNGRQNPTSQPSLSELDSMAPEFLQYGHLGLSQECMSILKESKRPSTRRSYAFKWKRFYIWCSQQGINPIRAQEDVILSYLLHLAKSGLQVSSIKVHLSAITAYPPYVEDGFFGGHYFSEEGQRNSGSVLQRTVHGFSR
ncbi:hypothetical protein NDU88_007885 [Pleurodeles waltl]|uniref:Core-binding (CB) domain-containing protein n=1 Tax=Pleurodeles waltl TaxID=8319 RepID=A0AAV7U211_PLEWA|nr:hypothetical protein NDU88_007885 [Pleurodeles waltl]